MLNKIPFVPKIIVCNICNKPIGCSVERGNTKFCINCSSNGNCLMGTLFQNGTWQGRVLYGFAHYQCSKEEAQKCLSNALFVST